MSESSPPTIQDIAQKVGVSKGAVSVVLNGASSSTRVSAITRQRILEVAQALNYRPNVAAQALTRGRMDTIGLMFSFSDTTIMARSLAMEILHGVSVVAGQGGKNLMLYTKPWPETGDDEQRLSDQRTDGIVVAMPRTEGNVLRELLAQPQPIVFIGYPGEIHNIPSVDMENEAGAVLATEHLVQLGHRRIAHIQGDDAFVCTGQRLSGFMQTLLKAGITVPPEYLVQASYSGRRGAERTRELLSLPNPPTAIFAGNDLIALAAMKAANEMGVSIPERLSLVGFDDIAVSPMAEASLTTVRQPFAEMGQKAAEMLLQKLSGEEVSTKTLLMPHQFIIRKTTAPPHKC